MYEFWESELSEEETDQLLDKAAAEIRKRKLNVPAILMLEMHKPLAYISANAAVATAPFLVPLFGFNAVNDYSRLLQKRENIEALIKRLEAPIPPALSTEDSCAT
jgi:acyl-CoA reductase-like NAD-dependent aldehyde dehydrogenase